MEGKQEMATRIQLLEQLKSTGELNIEFFQKDKEQAKVNIPKSALQQVFELVEPDNKNKNVEEYRMNVNDLKKKIMNSVPNFPSSEFQFFTGGKNEFELEDLYNQLNDNNIDDFDPFQESFKLIADYENNLDFDKLKQMSLKLGYGDINNRDIKILKECLDMDQDGKVSMKDFQDMVEFMQK